MLRERFLAIPNNSNTHTSFGAWSPLFVRMLRAAWLVGWSRTSRTRARKQLVGWCGLLRSVREVGGSLVKPSGAGTYLGSAAFSHRSRFCGAPSSHPSLVLSVLFLFSGTNFTDKTYWARDWRALALTLEKRIVQEKSRAQDPARAGVLPISYQRCRVRFIYLFISCRWGGGVEWGGAGPCSLCHGPCLCVFLLSPSIAFFLFISGESTHS